MIIIRGCREAFYAHPVGDEEIAVGTEIVIVDYKPPRVVIVSKLRED